MKNDIGAFQGGAKRAVGAETFLPQRETDRKMGRALTTSNAAGGQERVRKLRLGSRRRRGGGGIG